MGRRIERPGCCNSCRGSILGPISNHMILDRLKGEQRQMMHDLFFGKSNYLGDSFTTLIMMHTFSQSNPMPTEVIIRIFGELTLPDALHLAATCRRLRQVMKENTPAIYRRLRRQVPCERYARVVLADQGGPPPCSSSSMTIADLLRLRRNSRIVEKAIEVFDRDITAHIRSE